MFERGLKGWQHSSHSNRLAPPNRLNRLGSSSRRASAVADQVGTQDSQDMLIKQHILYI